MTTPSEEAARPTLFGHPTGLFMLFFAEMWERFSYYGMRALLVFYMIKGFLSYEDDQAYSVYGAYAALVYMTPFFGGLIADRLLGPRRAVIIGGLLMAAGHLLMGVESTWPFFTALALLIVGNGFFKPNISTIVGNLYPDGDPRRDGGFTLFYMGINLGAAAAPLLCGYIGETFGWHYGFGLATIGMLVGLAIFVMPSVLARYLTLGGALLTALSMVLIQEDLLLLCVNGFVAICLAIAGGIAFVAMGREGLRPEDGVPPDPELLHKGVIGPITWEHITYIGTAISIPLLAALVWANINVEIVPESYTEGLTESGSVVLLVAGKFLHEIARPAGLLLLVVGIVAIAYLLYEAFRSQKIERERLFVVLVLMFFSMLFWAFFEQAGSSMANFTDRNIDRITEERVITPDEVGTEVTLRLNQEQLGYTQDGRVFTLDQLDALKKGDEDEDKEEEDTRGFMQIVSDALSQPPPVVRLIMGWEREAEDDDPLVATWKIDESHVGMGVNGTEVPASTFQAANPIFILLFGLPIAGLWVFLGRRGAEPNTSIKFALGLLQLGLGFGALWYGATYAATDRGMVSMLWLLLGYLLHTTGELCLSPVGLSMVTKLSPKRLVSTVMGGWFLATALSAYLAAIIAGFTSPPKKDAAEGEAADASGADDTDGGTVTADADTPAQDTDQEPVAAPPTDDTDAAPQATDDTDAPQATDDTDALATVDEAPLTTPEVVQDPEDQQAIAADEAEDVQEATVAVEAKDPVPPPIETVALYGGVFGIIALFCIGSAVALTALSPLLQKWMHPELHGRDPQDMP